MDPKDMNRGFTSFDNYVMPIRRLPLVLGASLLLFMAGEASARNASFKKPSGSAVMTVDGASYGYPGTGVSYIYYRSDPSVFGVVSKVTIPASLSKNFRRYGKQLERTFKALDGKVKVTVRRNTYIIKGSVYGWRFYAKGILENRTVYAAGGYAQSQGARQRAIWKMIENFKVR